MIFVKHLAALLSLVAICLTNVYSQNLVPNPSFEISTEMCHFETWGSYTGASKWQSFRGSSDYLSKCNKWSFSESVLGTQKAATGESFAGFYALIPGDEREILGSELLAPLEIGRTYNVSIKFSMAEGYPDSGCDNVGILFLTKGYKSDTYQSGKCKTCLNYLPNNAHLYSKEIIRDYEGWTQVSGLFTADSNYTHIAIGNFFQNSQTKAEQVLSGNRGKNMAYYYVDDVLVEDTQRIGDQDYGVDGNFSALVMPNIFTPNDDGKNELFIPLIAKGISSMHTSIFDRLGNAIFATDNINVEWDARAQGEIVSAGVYYWVIRYQNANNKWLLKKGWVRVSR